MAFQAQVEEICEILNVDPAHVAAFNCDRLTALKAPCRGVTTDSRDVSSGALFIARRGESSDGHTYLAQAFDNGAVCALVERDWLAAGPQLPLTAQPEVLIPVADTTRALGDLARAWRNRINVPVLCVTGSNGKTTTKEILHSLLTELVGPGTASQKSFNNHVGLPQTLLGARPGDNFVLLEAGMNHAGELEYLSSICRPDVAIVVNVGPAHIEFFGTLEKIADAKFELLADLEPGGTAVIRGDDPVVLDGLARLEARIGRRLKTVRFGFSEECDVIGSEIKELGYEGIAFKVRRGAEIVDAKIPHLGRHNTYNALAAVSALLAGFPELTLAQAVEKLSAAAAAPMRLELMRHAGMDILNDAYNANPASMAAAVRTAGSLAQGGSFGLVLGDMLELGPHGELFHREIGRTVAEVRPSFLIAVGPNALFIAEEAEKQGIEVHAVPAAEQALSLLQSGVLPKVNLLLVKASRGMALERVIKGIVS